MTKTLLTIGLGRGQCQTFAQQGLGYNLTTNHMMQGGQGCP